MIVKHFLLNFSWPWLKTWEEYSREVAIKYCFIWVYISIIVVILTAISQPTDV